MKSHWKDKEAAVFANTANDALGLRVYTSRLLGLEPELVLHGGGNTSVKIREVNLHGEEEDILYIKGSGWDLATIDRPGFAPVRMAPLLKLAALSSLSDPQMVNELRTSMTNASAPGPSVETILHAILPYTFVDHTHADAIVTITNTPDGFRYVEEIFGDTVVVIPYIMPGFNLARLCAERFAAERNDNTLGMVLMNHGIFSFADSARESYERMIDLVSKAENFLQSRKVWDLPRPVKVPRNRGLAPDIAELRANISRAAGTPMIMLTRQDDECLAFANRPDVATLSQQGPATPDHVIRTKPLPMLGRDVDKFVEAYRAYFSRQAPQATDTKVMLDPAPRVILDKEMGLCSAGKSAKEARIVQDIYLHSMTIMQRAQKLGGYQCISEKDIFDMEYWDLEQAKLGKTGKPPVFSGEVALVTGAASGIGAACVESMRNRGAAVIALDIDPVIVHQYEGEDVLGIVCDVTDPEALTRSVEEGVVCFGGLDMLILNAGIFFQGTNISDLAMDQWQQAIDLNLTANLQLMQLAHHFLKLAPNGGRVVVMGSKNVPAPGPGAAPYSVSKAALTQLMRVAALEWGEDNIRINALHPNAVFDTALWNEEILADRARAYGVTVDEYKRRNVLKQEVGSHDVAELAAEMCGPLFARTTGAQLPVDGGDLRVI